MGKNRMARRAGDAGHEAGGCAGGWAAPRPSGAGLCGFHSGAVGGVEAQPGYLAGPLVPTLLLLAFCSTSLPYGFCQTHSC